METEMTNTESDIVANLLGLAKIKKEQKAKREIVIKRDGVERLRFTLEPLTEEQWRKCRRQNLKNVGRRNEELDDARFLSQAIFMATDENDRERLWNNKKVQLALNVASGIDVINEVLSPAEKSQLGELLEKISGYQDTELEVAIKN